MGNAIRYQLAYEKVDFFEIRYEFGTSEWADAKAKNEMGLPFPNIPYFINGDVKISEGLALHRYIASKWSPSLNGKTPEEKAIVDMVGG